MKKYPNVLIVEDDTTSAFLIKLLLIESDLVESISVAVNGEEALEYISRLKETGSRYPNLIFLDINMPVMNGFEFLEACKRTNCLDDREVKVIIITSSAHQTDINKAKELGIKDYLLKPVSAEAVLQAIQKEQGA